MIGVLCKDSERIIIREFFELFKTPWEFFDSSHNYEVVLSTCREIPEINSRLVIIFSPDATQFDTLQGFSLSGCSPGVVLGEGDLNLVIYGPLSSLEGEGRSLLVQSEGKCVAIEIPEKDQLFIRVGYNLFQEAKFLLTQGQPADNSLEPTLENHISLLRTWIVSSGITLIEIPPAPYGHSFIACLTHDVDFAGIRYHKLDHTFWGFLYRALLGSLVAFLRGKIRLAKLLTNWMAVIKLPLVFAGVADDFWEHFDKYADIEEGLSSTFFLIPFKNRTGDNISNKNLYKRAAHYDIGDVGKQVKRLRDLGFEIGLHGIDAWNSSERGSQEMKRITEAISRKDIGVRMHWLFYDHQSPVVLEQAGFEYDATLGYNETIGFRNGSLQVFQPFGVSKLLEIPLNIQDTALFYPRHLNLSDADAKQLCSKLLDAACLYSGVLTISWHERSIEPERLWGDCYKWLLDELRIRGAWIGNARQIVEWFRRRRSVAFKECLSVNHKFEIRIVGQNLASEHRMFLRLHLPSRSVETSTEFEDYAIDIPWNGEEFLEVLTNERGGE